MFISTNLNLSINMRIHPLYILIIIAPIGLFFIRKIPETLDAKMKN